MQRHPHDCVILLSLVKTEKNTSAVSIPIDCKWDHRRILQIIVDADFVNSALFIFNRAKHLVLTVQGQRMWMSHS